MCKWCDNCNILCAPIVPLEWSSSGPERSSTEGLSSAESEEWLSAEENRCPAMDPEVSSLSFASSKTIIRLVAIRVDPRDEGSAKTKPKRDTNVYNV